MKEVQVRQEQEDGSTKELNSPRELRLCARVVFTEDILLIERERVQRGQGLADSIFPSN